MAPGNIDSVVFISVQITPACYFVQGKACIVDVPLIVGPKAPKVALGHLQTLDFPQTTCGDAQVHKN